MIDTHCHLDSPRFDADRSEVLDRAWAAGLTGLVVPAIGPDRWESLLSLPREDRRIQIGLGIHPQLLPELPPEQDEEHLARLDALLARGGAIAVGECGLDGPSAPAAPMDRQVAILKRHFALARKYDLPLLLHCLRAHPALRALLEEEAPPLPGILLHSYSGSAELVKVYARRGCHFSFAGPVTFPEARRPLEAVRAVALDRLLAETDAPDQAPYPHRGGRSEPAYLRPIVEAMAQAHGVDFQELAGRTAENASRFFSGAFGGMRPPP